MVDVKAIGINFPDLLATKGQYQHLPELPYVPGCELSGVVRRAPASSGWQPGDRLAAFVWDGAYAEVARVPLNAAMRIDSATSFTTAAAMVVNYQTAHFALTRRGQLSPGEVVFVLGAAGGIGTASIQVARGLGARVIAGVADETKIETALAAGANDVVVLTGSFAPRVVELAGGHGVDVVLDPLGAPVFDEAMRTLSPEGRILVVGFAAGAIPTLRVNRLLLRNVSAVGVAWGAFLDQDPDLMKCAGDELNQMLAAGTVAPDVRESLRFADIPSALVRLEKGAILGKAVASLE